MSVSPRATRAPLCPGAAWVSLILQPLPLPPLSHPLGGQSHHPAVGDFESCLFSMGVCTLWGLTEGVSFPSLAGLGRSACPLHSPSPCTDGLAPWVTSSSLGSPALLASGSPEPLSGSPSPRFFSLLPVPALYTLAMLPSSATPNPSKSQPVVTPCLWAPQSLAWPPKSPA